MTAKQTVGLTAPDGSYYVTLTDGSGNTVGNTGASYTHVAAGQATTTIKSGTGILYAISFNGPASSTNVTTVFDSTTGSGTVIAIPLATGFTVPGTLSFGPGLQFATGLTILTATANGADMTVVYK